MGNASVNDLRLEQQRGQDQCEDESARSVREHRRAEREGAMQGSSNRLGSRFG